MARSSIHTFTKLVDEPFFISCGANLRDPRTGAQVATIQSIDTIRLERRTSTDPEAWESAVAASGFSSLQVLDDGSVTDAMIAGVLDADPDESPAPGGFYMIVAECTIVFGPAYGGGTTERVFRRRARIPASALTAPAS